MKTVLKELKRGILDENPVLIIVLGLCPSLATSTSLESGIGMGLAATFVLVCSNFIISLIRNIVPDKVRIPIYIVVIAAFVIIVEMVMKASFPDLSKTLGIFIPLIVVNCIILGRAEAYASKNGPLLSLLDGLAMGLGFIGVLSVLSIIREFLGANKLWGLTVIPGFEPAAVMQLAPGGFCTIALLMALRNWNMNRKKRKA
jgi:electron transport complex protein RnfE